MDGYHKSVLLREALELLDIKSGKWYLDCTLGDGGYSLEILKRGGSIVGIDQDPQALQRTRERFLKERINEHGFEIKEGNFSKISELVQDRKFLGVVFDLGVSTLQLKDAARGFSFLKEGPLDMRMSPNLQVRAVDLINVLNVGELEQLIRNYGEERNARRIAKAIIKKRPINSTVELADLVEKTMRGRHSKIHPATKTFQALRIAVNDELESLKAAFSQALDLLLPGGTVVVVSFHSLEDGIVKNTFQSWQQQGLGQILTEKVIGPSKYEVGENISSRSAKLRAFEKSIYEV